MKRALFAVVLAALLISLLPATAMAGLTPTINVSAARAQAGETVTVSGVAEATELLSIKVTDEEGNIVYFNAAHAGNDGTYAHSFTVPDVTPQTLTIVSGNGSTVASAQVAVYIRKHSTDQKHCTIKFNKNGGDTNADPITMTVNKNEAITALPTPPQKKGFIFGGWYTDKECITAWDSSNAVTTDITVYAKWMINTYTVKFYQANGKTQIGAVQNISWGSVAVEQTAPTVDGYTFSSWKLTGDDETAATSLSSVKENIVAIATYVKANATPTATATAKTAATPAAASTEKPKATPAATSTEKPNTTPAAASTMKPAAALQTADLSAIFQPVTTGSPASIIIPKQISKDEKAGTITVVIDADDLPEGTQAIQLPDGRIVDVSGGGTVSLEFNADDMKQNNMSHITAIDEEGKLISDLPIQVVKKSGLSTFAIVLCCLGLLAAGFVVIRKKERR